MVASRGGYRMARGRHYAKLSLSNAARLSFSDLCILLFMFLSLCRLCVCVFLCSHWSLVDVPLIFFCPADHVPDWQPRVLLGMVEARSVNVKKTTKTTTTVEAGTSNHPKLAVRSICGSPNDPLHTIRVAQLNARIFYGQNKCPVDRNREGGGHRGMARTYHDCTKNCLFLVYVPKIQYSRSTSTTQLFNVYCIHRPTKLSSISCTVYQRVETAPRYVSFNIKHMF